MTAVSLGRRPTRLMQRYLEPDPQAGVMYPDCYRTAIAMALGCASPDDVPHFAREDGTGINVMAMKDWLAAQGIQLVYVPLPDWSAKAVEDRLPFWLGAAPAILSGTTVEGHGHVVAVIDGRIVDTVDYTTGNPLDGPSSDGLWWLGLFLPIPAAP